MKALIFIILATISFNSFAADLDTAGLVAQEIQAINQASSDELKELNQCLIDFNETKLNETSCINDVLGDVHN